MAKANTNIVTSINQQSDAALASILASQPSAENVEAARSLATGGLGNTEAVSALSPLQQQQLSTELESQYGEAGTGVDLAGDIPGQIKTAQRSIIGDAIAEPVVDTFEDFTETVVPRLSLGEFISPIDLTGGLALGSVSEAAAPYIEEGLTGSPFDAKVGAGSLPAAGDIAGKLGIDRRDPQQVAQFESGLRLAALNSIKDSVVKGNLLPTPKDDADVTVLKETRMQALRDRQGPDALTDDELSTNLEPISDTLASESVFDNYLKLNYPGQEAEVKQQIPAEVRQSVGLMGLELASQSLGEGNVRTLPGRAGRTTERIVSPAMVSFLEMHTPTLKRVFGEGKVFHSVVPVKRDEKGIATSLVGPLSEKARRQQQRANEKRKAFEEFIGNIQFRVADPQVLALMVSPSEQGATLNQATVQALPALFPEGKVDTFDDLLLMADKNDTPFYIEYTTNKVGRQDTVGTVYSPVYNNVARAFIIPVKPIVYQTQQDHLSYRRGISRNLPSMGGLDVDGDKIVVEAKHQARFDQYHQQWAQWGQALIELGSSGQIDPQIASDINQYIGKAKKAEPYFILTHLIDLAKNSQALTSKRPFSSNLMGERDSNSSGTAVSLMQMGMTSAPDGVDLGAQVGILTDPSVSIDPTSGKLVTDIYTTTVRDFQEKLNTGNYLANGLGNSSAPAEAVNAVISGFDRNLGKIRAMPKLYGEGDKSAIRKVKLELLTKYPAVVDGAIQINPNISREAAAEWLAKEFIDSSNETLAFQEEFQNGIRPAINIISLTGETGYYSGPDGYVRPISGKIKRPTGNQFRVEVGGKNASIRPSASATGTGNYLARNKHASPGAPTIFVYDSTILVDSILDTAEMHKDFVSLAIHDAGVGPPKFMNDVADNYHKSMFKQSQHDTFGSWEDAAAGAVSAASKRLQRIGSDLITQADMDARYQVAVWNLFDQGIKPPTTLTFTERATGKPINPTSLVIPKTATMEQVKEIEAERNKIAISPITGDQMRKVLNLNSSYIQSQMQTIRKTRATVNARKQRLEAKLKAALRAGWWTNFN